MGKQTFVDQKTNIDQGRNWYAVHTASGCEETVAKNLQQRIDSLEMSDKVFNIVVPTEKKIKIRAGKRYTVEEKIFPGYVMVEMIIAHDSWYVVRNTPHVTGFLGAGSTPIPLSRQEVETLFQKMSEAEPKYKIDFRLDDLVKITDGPFKNYEGKVSEIDKTKGKIKILISIFGRETPVELDFLQVKRV